MKVNRTVPLKILLTENEMSILRERSEKLGIGLAGYLRMKALQ